ncbi:trypsin-like serine peptidase [Ideonella sp. YS5]|uniref:trypsin-like serine peptidase n=1 Tax=Ideonella sp. YS5 TaxID=3453714 RepID=UPI003EE83A18
MAKDKGFIHCVDEFAFLLGVMLVSVTPSSWGQPAPALRAVVSADAAPEAMSQLFAQLGDGKRTISVPGAAWLQLQFSEVRLGPDGLLTIIDASGESQTFSQTQIDAWSGLSAVFNGSELRLSLRPGEGAEQPVSAKIKNIVIGLPASSVSSAGVVTPQPLRKLLGPDVLRFIPDNLRGLWKEGEAPRVGAGTEAICGATDDRAASANPRTGRIMPIGCTGWLIDGGNLLTAGHCIGPDTQTVEFNVPASQADGTTVAPPVRDQYRVDAQSIVDQRGGVGNDWAMFQVLPNTQTRLMPAAAQGATFQLSNSDNPAQVRITGYGVDGPAPNFGAGGPRNAQNQTQQTHVGALSENTGGATSGVLRYATDTQGGNSGSPVIVEGGNVAIGIHTNGGCTQTGGTNAGTSFRNEALWTTVHPAPTAPYQAFGLQTGTVLHPTDPTFEFGVATNGDVFAIKKSGTQSGTTEIHVLSAASRYQQFSLQTRTALHPTDQTFEFGVAANRDVFAIKKSGASGTTEIHVLSAASGYQQFSLQTRTALHPTDHTFEFGVAANRDVFAIKKSGASGTTEIHVLSAASGYQQFSLQTRTALHPTDHTFEFGVAANRDVFAIKKSGTQSGTTEIHALRR